MTYQDVLGALIWKRPGEGFNLRDNPAGVTMDDVVWHAVTTKPTDVELAAWVADYIAQGIAAQQEVDRRIDGEKVLKAIVLWANDRANDAADQWNAFRAVVAAATSLADLKTGVSGSTANLPTTTPAQAKAEILAIYKAL